MRQLCVHRDMKHLGSLESTQEARFARGVPLIRIFHALQTSRVPHISMNVRRCMNQLLNGLFKLNRRNFLKDFKVLCTVGPFKNYLLANRNNSCEVRLPKYFVMVACLHWPSKLNYVSIHEPKDLRVCSRERMCPAFLIR